MRRILGPLTACVLAVLAAPAAAAPPFEIGPDGKTAEVHDLSAAVRERVYIPQPGIDQDADGIEDRIAVEILRPAGSGPDMKVPAIIDPSPYYTTVCRGAEGECIGDTDADGRNDKWPLFYDNFFVPRGYAYVLAESNGTANSTGCPGHAGPGDIAGMRSVVDWLNGRAPAYTTLLGTTAVSADWHTGKAAMIGKSYDGSLANGVAATGVEGLTTIVPISAISDWYGYSRMGGISTAGNNYPSYLSNLVTDTARQPVCLPSRQAMDVADGDGPDDRNPFWEARSPIADVAKVKASVFVVHGLQDDNVETDQFAQWWSALGSLGVPRKLWLLRAGHEDPFDVRRAEWVDTLHRWFDHWLLGVPNGITGAPAVDLQATPSVWETHASWPVPETRELPVYLQATGADTAGAVGLSSGGNADTVAFTGATLNETGYMDTPTGAQTARRVFLSPPLEKDLRLSGTPRVELEASLDRTQANLGALVVDYGPSAPVTRSSEGITLLTTKSCWGQSSTVTVPLGDHDACYFDTTQPTIDVGQWRIARGILDSSNRLSLTTPTPVTAGERTPFAWPLQPTDWVFKAGHQIGVIVVGDYFGRRGTPGTVVTIDTRRSQIVLPLVGGYPAAVASGAFTKETVPPAITVPADMTVAATDADGAVVNYPDPGVTDNEDPAPTATCTPASGSRFPVGTTPVACTARDLTGNESAPATFTVTVTRSDPPGATPTPTPTPVTDPPAPSDPTPGGVPVPPAPAGSGGAPPADGSPKPPTLDTVDRLAPRVSSLVLRLRRGVVRATFRLSERATVTVSVRRLGAKRNLKVVRRALAAGRRTVDVRALGLRRAGRYVLTLRAVDRAGNVRVVTRSITMKRRGAPRRA